MLLQHPKLGYTKQLHAGDFLLTLVSFPLHYTNKNSSTLKLIKLNRKKTFMWIIYNVLIHLRIHFSSKMLPATVFHKQIVHRSCNFLTSLTEQAFKGGLKYLSMVEDKFSLPLKNHTLFYVMLCLAALHSQHINAGLLHWNKLVNLS